MAWRFYKKVVLLQRKAILAQVSVRLSHPASGATEHNIIQKASHDALSIGFTKRCKRSHEIHSNTILLIYLDFTHLMW